MKIKRVFAYIIDIVIVSFISTLIFMLPFFKSSYYNYNQINNDYSKLIEEITLSGSADVDENKLVDIQYNLNKSSSTLLIIRLGVIVLYFGAFGFLSKGQTIGKKIVGLQIVNIDQSKNIHPGLFMLREVLVVNFIPDLISLLVLVTCNKNIWFKVSVYTNYVALLMTFLIVGFMIFRDDERGLHDVICKTKVIDTKKSKVNNE